MKKAKLTERLGAKLAAWFLLALCVLGAFAAAVGIYAAWALDIYSAASAEDFKLAEFNDLVANTGFELARGIVASGQTQYGESLAQRTNAEYRLLDGDGAELWKSAGFDALAESPYHITHVFQEVKMSNGGACYYYVNTRYAEAGPVALTTPEPTPTPEVLPTGMPQPTPVPTATPTPTPEPAAGAAAAGAEAALTVTGQTDYLLEAVVDPALPLRDEFHWLGLGLGLLWGMRYGVYVLAGLALLLGLACFVFLLCAAGHRAGREELTPGYFTRVPFDIVTAAAALVCAGAVYLADEHLRYAGAQIIIPGACALSVALALVFTLWCSSLALRVKLGKWWENTVIFWLLRLVAKAVRALLGLLRQLPLVWRTAALILAVCLLELWVYFGFDLWSDTEWFLAAWFAEKLLLGGAALYLALVLRRLQAGGAALAAGDLHYQTDTRGMPGDFRRHGEHLNSAAAGMEAAVARQMRSERMKTELITNVSHDIRTPLTGIISYAELLKTAETEAQRAEYLAALDRQAQRLKKLTEDLIEVSKASTGNVEVALSRHSVSELLRQAVGEYSERLEQAGLETVLTLPEGEVFAALDGRLMWRVLDNLLGNACKYAQAGTRFYIDAVTENGAVFLRFKNVSRERLNVSAEELMERFVRGDSARSGEGSGLGLSIARSLTELQRGSFALTVDGDLFKAELTFPAG